MNRSSQQYLKICFRMPERISLKNIKTGLRNTRHLLSLSGMGFKYEHHLQYVIFQLTNGCLAMGLLSYSLYYYRSQIDKLAVIVHHAILVVDVCTASAIGYILKDKFDNYLDGKKHTIINFII